MEENTNAPRHALPHLPRPVFLSYSRRDFRIAYYIWQQMLSPDSKESHFDQVLMDFPSLMPPDMKLEGIQANVSTADHPLSMGVGYEDDWSPDMPGWMVGIGGNLIRCESLVVVLTPNSEHSEAVDTELKAFEAFPEKPITFLSVNRTPIPERYAKFERAMVHDVAIDIKSMLANGLRAAYEAQDNKQWLNAALLFTEALQRLPLLPDASVGLYRDILTGRGRADIQLGYRDQAVRMFEQALELTDPKQRVLYAGVLYNLGWAHATEARHEIGRARESVVSAQSCWERALNVLEAEDTAGQEIAEVEKLRASCHEGQTWATRLLEANQRALIAAILQDAGKAEQARDWTAMCDLYEKIFSLYRLGGNGESGVITDMLSAKARAERKLDAWDDARKTLEFALTLIDEDDSASRAGLMHDLGCVQSRRKNGQPPEALTKEQLSAAYRCWTEALELAKGLMSQSNAKHRYDVAGLARTCEQLIDWARYEMESRAASKE